MKIWQVRLRAAHCALVGALALLPAVAAAQSPETRIDTAMARATRAGIPTSLLESKVAEGRAKGVAMDRIAGAVENRLQGLERAQTAMRRGANDIDAAQIAVGADAINAGISEAVLERISATSGKDRRGVAVAALTQLVSQGVSVDNALVRVQQAVAQGPRALANLAAQTGVGTRVTGTPAVTPTAAIEATGAGGTTAGRSGGASGGGGTLTGPVEAPSPRPTGNGTKPTEVPNPRVP